MAAATSNLWVKSSVASFILPLGSTKAIVERHSSFHRTSLCHDEKRCRDLWLIKAMLCPLRDFRLVATR